jgi:hypothetical protein
MSIGSSRWSVSVLLGSTALLACFGIAGCERKEKIVDVQTPGGSVEVERNVDTGEVEVEANEN